MDVTGVTLDVSLSNIKTTTMHRFTAAVEDIINEEGQEVKIENELAAIDAM